MVATAEQHRRITHCGDHRRLYGFLRHYAFSAVSNDACDPNTGASVTPADPLYATNHEQTQYNLAGELIRQTGQDDVTHLYTYNALGKQTADTVTGFPPPVNGVVPIDETVAKIATTYNTLGEAVQIQSLTAGGAVESTVAQTFDGLGDMTSQTTSGLVQNGVNASGAPTYVTVSNTVGYSYNFTTAGGSSSGSDTLATMTYPDGYVLTYAYGNAADQAMGRPTGISDSTGTLATFTYSGTGTQELSQSDNQAGINLAVTLNQFGEVANQNWTNGTTVLSDNQYLYNNDGMVTYASDSATGLTASLGGAYGYNALNQLTQYQRGNVSISGSVGSISGVTETQQLTWNPQGALIGEAVNGTTVLNNTANAQNQNTSNTYNANGDTGSSTNAAGSTVNTVYNAWGQPVSYTITQPDTTDGGTVTVGQETIQYDAMGRPLGEYQTYNFPTSTPGVFNTETTQHTLVYDANSGEVIQQIKEINGQYPVRYVYGPNGNVIMQQSGTNGSTTINQTLYALQGADGSTVAITDNSGNVVERYVYDGLGNAQALQADGTSYAADSTPGSTGTPGQQINEYFVGSTFDSSGNQTADGTHYNWTILYQGETYDAMPGVYITPQGAFNPRQQSLLAPDLNAIQQGLSAYDPTGGEGGFQNFVAGHLQAMAFGASAVAGTAVSILTWGAATPWVAAALDVEATSLGIVGTAAVGAISGTVGGAASGFAYSAGMGASPLQIAESTVENGLFGGMSGGVLGSAGGWIGNLLGGEVAESTTNTVGALEDWSNVDFEARLAARDNAWETDNVINIHGNSINSPQTAYLYGLYDKETNQLLKWGISQNPAIRYSRVFMEDKVIRPIMSGSRALMLQQERNLVETQPGPLNFEPWAGSRAGGQ